MHKTRNVSELRTANRNGAFLCSTLRAKGLHSYLAQLAHSLPHTVTLSHCAAHYPFCEPALMHFLLPTSVDPPPLQLASLRQDAAREGSDAGNIIAGHQQLLSAE